MRASPPAAPQVDAVPQANREEKTRTRYGCNRQQARHLHHHPRPRPAGIPRQRLLSLGRDGQARGAHREPSRRQRRERARPRVLPGGTHAALHHQHMHRAHGGNFSPTVDGAAIPMYAAIMVHRGSVLEFGAPKTGVYGYLAIAGGSIAGSPKVMGSASTNLKCGIGGWGRTRAFGGRLPALRHQERRFPGQSGLARAQRRQLLRFLVRRNRLARSAGTAGGHVHRTGR